MDKSAKTNEGNIAAATRPADQTLKKPRNTTILIPTMGKLTAESRKLLASFMYFAQRHLMSLPPGMNFDASDFFEARFRELVEPVCNVNSISTLKQYVREMESIKVEWSAPDASDGVIWDSMHLLSQVKLVVENGSVYVKWGFPPDIVRALSNPGEYGYLITRLEDYRKLQTYEQVALYELAIRYIDNPSHKTSRRPKDWWVRALSPGFALNTRAEEKKYRPYPQFKIEKIKPAIEYLRETLGLDIQLDEQKEGRTITDVQLIVRRVPGFQKSQTNKTLLTGPVVELASSLGINEQIVNEYMKDGFTQETLCAALHKIRAVVDKEPGKINNVNAYFRACMGTITPDLGLAPAPTLIEAADSKQNSFDFRPSEAVVDAVVTDAVVTRKTPESIETDFRANVFAMRREEFMGLPDSRRQVYLDGVNERLSRRNLLTALVLKKLAEGDWRFGPILSEAVAAYAEAEHGERWAEGGSKDAARAIARPPQ